MKNNKKKDINEQIEELVSQIDSFMSKENAGHMNITVDKDGEVNRDEVLIDNTGKCVNGACKAPTLFEGLDDLTKED